MNSSLSFGLISISLVSSSENPTMALSGVRISWLILARNADFIWSASSALIRALIRSSSTSLLCWIFKQSPFTPTLLRVESCPFFAIYLNSHHMPFAVEIISAAGDLTGRESCIKQVLMLDEIFPVFRVDRLLELRGGDRFYRHIQRLIEIMVELEYAVAVSECENITAL